MDYDVFEILLTPAQVDKFDISLSGAVIGPRGKQRPFDEQIKKYPDGYIVKNSYNICLQNTDAAYKNFITDENARMQFFNHFKDQSFEEWHNLYTKDSVDYFVCFCLVADSSGKEYLIFDENNDEDLSNDEARIFKPKSILYRGKSIEYEYADAMVKFNYFDGKKIKESTYGIRLFRGKDFRGDTFAMASMNVNWGTLQLSDKKYIIGITKFPDVEFSKYDQLWIDLNQNGKFDHDEDYNQQMYLPFTLDGKTYGLERVDRFGKSLFLRCFNPDSIPPIAVGMQAPDFVETTMDSLSTVHLRDYNGKFVVLDFWTCNSNNGVLFTHDLYEKLNGNKKIQIISFGPYFPQFMTEQAKEKKITWQHIKGLFDVKTRNLYQVGSAHTTVLVDTLGKIIMKKEYPSAEEIIKMINLETN